MAAGAFALEKTIGGGILFNSSTTSGTITSVPGVGNVDWNWPRNGGGVFGFFGLSRYFELNLGVLYKNAGEFKSDRGSFNFELEPASALQIGVYGKYPILLSDKLVVFPTGGIDYEMNTSDDDSWWDDFWFRAGAGADFFLRDRIFLRGHLLYGAAIPIGDDIWGLKLTHGLLVKVGVGWMF
jgi:hypothetical protein